jgi:hypothetical protein
MHLALLQDSLELSLFGQTVEQLDVIGVVKVGAILKSDVLLEEGIGV